MYLENRNKRHILEKSEIFVERKTMINFLEHIFLKPSHGFHADSTKDSQIYPKCYSNISFCRINPWNYHKTFKSVP